MNPDNRRKDFRVEIALQCEWRALTKNEIEHVRKGMGADLIKQAGLPSPIDEILKEIPVGSREEQWYRSLQLLNNKLDFIIDHLVFETGESRLHRDKIFELSGSGLKFTTREKLASGNFLKINMVSPGTFQYQVQLIAQVKRVEKKGEEFMVAAQTVFIEEEAKDAIIKVVFQKQRQEIRREKLQQGG